MKLSHNRAVLLMVAVPLMWSIAGVVTRQLDQARSFEVTFWRSFFTALSLLVILPLWQGRAVFRAMPWGRSAFWVSGLCWSIMFTAFMLALTITTVANVLVTLALGPLLTALIARLFMGQRIAPRTWAAIVLAGLGVGYMYSAQIRLGETSALLGSLVALCVPVASAINWTVVQRSQAHGQKIDLVPSVLVGAVLSSLLTLPLSFPFVASHTDVAWLALLGGVQLAIPCTLLVICARVLKAHEISLLALLEIIFGILWAWLGADEIPSRQVLLGGALVVSALAGNEWLAWRERSFDTRVSSRPPPAH
jgi:drug/metabolite transporter (DMT)-like permease